MAAQWTLGCPALLLLGFISFSFTFEFVECGHMVKACGWVSMLFYDKRVMLAWTVSAYTPVCARWKGVGPGMQMGEIDIVL